MNIFERLNKLREERSNLLNRANACPEGDMEELGKIRARLDAVNAEIADAEAIAGQMAQGARRVENQERGEDRREATFGEQLQQVAASAFASRGMRINGLTPRANEFSGQNETVPADGGVLLSPTVTTALLKGVRERSFFLPRVRRLAVGPNSNSVEMPYWPNKDRSDSGRYGGAKAYWMNEGEKYTPSKTQFATRTMKLAKLGALGYATEEILRDSTFLESIMTDAFISAMVWEVDEAIALGAGTVEGETARPLGMLNTGNKALITVPKAPDQAANTVTAENIMAMYNRMDPASRARAVWLVNPDVEVQLMKMTIETGSTADGGSFGQMMYMPPNGLSAQPYGTLFGRPVIANEHAPALGTLGDISFIDLSEYFWLERDGMRKASSVHVRFEYDEMAFKFTYRCNGTPSQYAASTPAKGSTTRSPYVTLAARG